MKITVEMALPSLKNFTKDDTTIKEGLELIVTTILEIQFSKHKILPCIGDHLLLSDLEDSACPVRFKVSERMFYMYLADGKEAKVHFVVVESE